MDIDILNEIASGNTLVIHVINTFVLIILITLLITARTTSKRWLKVNDYLGTITRTINSVRYGDLTKKIEKAELPNSEPLAESLNRMIETLYDREKMVSEYQNELHRQNKLLEAVINSLSDGLIIIDENLRVLRATPKISEWFGMEGNRLMGEFLTDHIGIPYNKTFYNLKETEVIIFSDKSSNFIANSIELKLEDKKKRYVIVIRNVTDQMELENLKEDFVATLTHDLKVPIIAETNMLELFLNESFGKVTEK